MRKTGVAALAAGMLLALTGLTAAQAGVHPDADGTGAHCDNHTGPTLCMTSDGTTGDAINGQTFGFSSTRQNINVSQVGDACTDGNGNPTSLVQSGQGSDGPACPFLNGLGLNIKYDHDQVVEIHNQSQGLYFYVVNYGDNVKQDSSSHAGVYYVADSNGNGYWSYVSVKSSNNFDENGTGILMCAPSSTGNAITANLATGDGRCSWLNVGPA